MNNNSSKMADMPTKTTTPTIENKPLVVLTEKEQMLIKGGRLCVCGVNEKKIRK